MTVKEAKSIFCLGIGGIGVSAIARLLAASGKKVTGTDLRDSAITKDLQKNGIQVSIGPNPLKLDQDFDLIIYSQDVPQTDVNKLQGVKLTQAQALGQLMEGHYGVGITGTNGKSTTTAMLGLILDKAGLDPSVMLGSMLSLKNETDKFKFNARLGAGKYFVAESDEYHRKMLDNKPSMIVLSNIAEDHLDYYKDLEDIRSAFAEYVKSMPEDGILIYNADDHNSVDVGKHANCHKYTFAIHHYADLQALNVKSENGRQMFDLHLNDEMIGQISLQVPGHFNILNALGASLSAFKLGVEFEVIKKSLEEFAGIWRRFEIVGNLAGKPVISDYGHHPAAITGTIEAARQFYPGKKILVVFQPHHRNRTKALFGHFVDSLVVADEIILPEIFDVTGREHGEDISSSMLVTELNKLGAQSTFAQDLDETEKLIKEKAPNFDAILMMGAGDIDLLARKLVV